MIVYVPGRRFEEDVGAVAVGRLAEVDGVAEVVGAVQGDRDAGDALLAEVDLAVVVEVREDDAGEARRRQDNDGRRRAGAGQEVRCRPCRRR